MPKRPNKRHGRYLKPGNFALILIGVSLIAVLIKKVGSGEIISNFEIIEKRYIFLIFFMYLGVFLVGNLRLKLFVDKISKIGYLKLLPVYFVGIFVNNLTPGPSAGGEPVKAYFLAKIIKQDISKCFASTIMETAAHGVTLIGFTLFSIAYVLMYLKVKVVSIFFEISITLLLVGVLFLIYLLKIKRRGTLKSRANSFLQKVYNFRFFSFLRKRFSKFEDFRETIVEKINLFVNTAKLLLKDKRNILKVLFVSIIFLILDYLKIWVIFIGLGQDVTFLDILVIVTIAKVISYFIFLPGGVGVVEISSVAMFSAVGVPPGIATTAVLIDRVMFYTFSYLVGYGSLGYLKFKYRQ